MNESNFTPQSGQALTELALVLPVIILLFGAALNWTMVFGDRLKNDSDRLDTLFQQRKAQTAEGVRELRLGICRHSDSLPRVNPQTNHTHIGAEVHYQFAHSLSARRLSCFGEGNARLGPSVAIPLWTLLTRAPTEAIARTTALQLCPATLGFSAQLRTSVLSGHSVNQTLVALGNLTLRLPAGNLCRRE